jgi:uncharacterized lipoprotein YajG
MSRAASVVTLGGGVIMKQLLLLFSVTLLFGCAHPNENIQQINFNSVASEIFDGAG